MIREQNFLQYHKSIIDELRTTKDKIRYLIGSKHWLTDGEHKEAIIRKVLKNFLPETYRVGQGFICNPTSYKTSSQIDILISSINKPTLFKDGELVFVTPDAVDAIIEVKTGLSRGRLKSALIKLAENLELARSFDGRIRISGLFLYDEPDLSDEEILVELNRAARGRSERALTLFATPNRFIRFWENHVNDFVGVPERSEWRCYRLNNNMSHAYLINNVVVELSGAAQTFVESAWFPVLGGKEAHKTFAGIPGTHTLIMSSQLIKYRTRPISHKHI